MQVEDIVHIEGISEVEIRHPLYALVTEATSADPRLVILTGGYNATGNWCVAGFRFVLPHKPTKAGAKWRVVAGDEIPDEVCVAIAKQALSGPTN